MGTWRQVPNELYRPLTWVTPTGKEDRLRKDITRQTREPGDRSQEPGREKGTEGKSGLCRAQRGKWQGGSALLQVQSAGVVGDKGRWKAGRRQTSGNHENRALSQERHEGEVACTSESKDFRLGVFVSLKEERFGHAGSTAGRKLTFT